MLAPTSALFFSRSNSSGSANQNGSAPKAEESEIPVKDSGKKDDANSHDSVLYIPFMGSSSRFSSSSPISTLTDITALEKERLSHFPPKRVSDHCCIYLVKFLRWCADKLFRERYIHRATMLKPIAPAPALAGAMVNYIRMMLRKETLTYVPSKGGFATETRGLLAQAESHACHIQILMSMAEITFIERLAVFFLQTAHFTIFALLFLLCPRVAFRLMGYLGEESVVIWTHMINDIDFGRVSERPIPQTAIDYWGLHKFKIVKNSAVDANKSKTSESLKQEEQIETETPASNAPDEEITLRDIILLLRSDEMIWRDACHGVANDMDLLPKKTFRSLFLS